MRKQIAESRLEGRCALATAGVALLLCASLATPAYANVSGPPPDSGYYEPSYEEILRQEQEAEAARLAEQARLEEEARLAEEARLREEANARALDAMKELMGPGLLAFDEEAVQSAAQAAEEKRAAQAAAEEARRAAEQKAALKEAQARAADALAKGLGAAAACCVALGAALFAFGRLKLHRQTSKAISSAMHGSSSPHHKNLR